MTDQTPTHRAIVIPADGSPIYEAAIPQNVNDGLDKLNKIVGGYIEGIRFPDRDDVHVYINEEGKYNAPTRNERATKLLKPVLQSFDYIAGNAVLVGSGDDGNEADLPADLIQELIV